MGYDGPAPVEPIKITPAMRREFSKRRMAEAKKPPVAPKERKGERLTTSQRSAIRGGLAGAKKLQDAMRELGPDSTRKDLAEAIENMGLLVGIFVNAHSYPDGVAFNNQAVRIATLVRDG